MRSFFIYPRSQAEPRSSAEMAQWCVTPNFVTSADFLCSDELGDMESMESKEKPTAGVLGLKRHFCFTVYHFLSQLIIVLYIYGVVSLLTVPPPMVWGGGVGTRIRYTHCISSLCRLSTLPQYYKPPPHHSRGGNLYTTTIPQTTPTPQGGGGNPLLPPPMGGEGGGDRPTLHHIFKITNYYVM